LFNNNNNNNNNNNFTGAIKARKAWVNYAWEDMFWTQKGSEHELARACFDGRMVQPCVRTT